VEAPRLERKLVAILAADVEGYSRHMERDEAATLATLSAHRMIVDDLINSHNGRITGTAGDSVLAEFASVVEAVDCAVKIQDALAAANEDFPDEHRLQFRIGINVGDVMVKDGDNRSRTARMSRSLRLTSRNIPTAPSPPSPRLAAALFWRRRDRRTRSPKLTRSSSPTGTR
jgi:class 3 adenylate cyclase